MGITLLESVGMRMKKIDHLNLPDKYLKFLTMLNLALQNDMRIEKVVLFGSCSKGSFHEGSDIDLAVITKENLSKEEEVSFYDYLLDIEPEDYVSCDLLVMSKKQFEEYKSKDGYVQKYIFRDGVELNGSIRASV